VRHPGLSGIVPREPVLYIKRHSGNDSRRTSFAGMTIDGTDL